MNSWQTVTKSKALISRGMRVLACLLMLMGLANCNYFLGPKADSEQPFQKGVGDTACVKDVGAHVEEWFEEGRGDIGESIDCAILAVDEFTRHVVGETDGRYSRGEIANFFRTYLAQAGSPLANDADAWTHEAMTLKQIAFGGGTGSITKEEIARIRAFLLRAKPVLAGLTPHIKTVFLRPAKVLPEEAVEAQDAVEKLTAFVAHEFSASVSERPTTNAEAVLASARRMGIDSSQLNQWIPIATAVKAIVVGGEREKIRAEEWTPMIQAAGRVWALTLRGKYEIYRNQEWLGDNFAATEAVIYGFVDLLETAVKNHRNGIPLSDWETVVDALDDKDYLKGDITGPTVKRLLPIVFGKLLYGNSKPDHTSKSVIFGPEQFSILKKYIKDWALGERLVISTFGRSDVLDYKTLLRELSSEAAFLNAGIPAADLAQAQKVRATLVGLYSEGRPLVHDGNKNLVVVPKSQIPSFRRFDLDRMNIVRIFVSSVMRGWAHEKKAVEDGLGIKEEEAQEVYLDVKDIGAELGFMDVRNNAAGIRTFMEGGIFTSVSDGSGYMSPREGIEWFHFVMAAGGVADVINDRMLAEGCGTKSLDVLGKEMMATGCFREKFIAQFGQYFPNLPHMTRWVLEDRSGARTRQILLALEDAGRTKGAIDAPVEATELRSMIPILHYAESLFARHDANKDDILDDDELDAAFPILAPFIKKMGEGKADGTKMQRAIFSYLIKFGEPPKSDLMSTGKLLAWYVIGGLFDKKADRLKVLAVMASFGKAAKATRMRDIGSFVKKHKKDLRDTLSNRKVDSELAELFQCHPDAADLVGQTFGRNSGYVTTDGDDVDRFVERGQLAIASEPRLRMKCLPF